MATSRNAPCPCGSGKKYKLCCLSADGGTPPTSAAEVAAKAVRAKAFTKLATFGAQPAFDSDLRRAVEAFWSPVFLRRDEAELAAAYACDRDQGGELTYFTIDAPTALGETIVECFLSEPRKGLLTNEQDYLRRLSASRMGLFRIDDVRKNQGLTCTDLWSGERIELREGLLTHDAAAGDVIGARPVAAADGVRELDGGIYFFKPAQGDELLAILRAKCSTAREAVPTLTEERFLKHRAAPIINRFWFAHVFFSVDEDDIEAEIDEDFADELDARLDDDIDAGLDDDIEDGIYDDIDAFDDDTEDGIYEDVAFNEDFLGLSDEALDFDDADLPFPSVRNAERALSRRPRRLAEAGIRTDIASADSQLLELRDFLDSDGAPGAMPIDWLHGFLCAIACGPMQTSPRVWLTRVWGDTPPAFDSPEQADHISAAIIELAYSIGQEVREKTFVPLLPRNVTGDRTNIAQGWCAGFEEAIRMDAASWTPLLEVEERRKLVAPVFIITSSDDVDDDAMHAKTVAQAIGLLPAMVSLIDDYWTGAPLRSPLRGESVLARHRPSDEGTISDAADDFFSPRRPAR